MAISTALIQLVVFIRGNSEPSSGMGQRCNFDNVIMRASYDRVDIPCPWHFANDRDVRTIVELGRTIGINPGVIFRLKVICIMLWLMPNTRLNTFPQSGNNFYLNIGEVTMNTMFLLMAEYGSATVQLSQVCENILV
jgi:hypothetical protein